MYKSYFLAALVFFATLSVVQARPILRHTTGLQGVGVQAGISSIGNSMSMGYRHHFSEDWQLGGELGIEIGRFTKRKIHIMSLKPLLLYTLYTNHSNLFITLFKGAGGTMEMGKKAHFNVEVSLGSSLAWYLFNQLSCTISGGVRYALLERIYGNLGYFVSLGIQIGF